MTEQVLKTETEIITYFPNVKFVNSLSLQPSHWGLAGGGVWWIYHSMIENPQRKACVKYEEVLKKETEIITNFPQMLSFLTH